MFVSGLDPAAVREDYIWANPVFRGINWSLRYDVAALPETARPETGWAALDSGRRRP